MFEEVTVGELQEKMKSGSLSASALTKAYLARIEELDKGRVNSMIEINPGPLPPPSISSPRPKAREGRCTGFRY